MRTKNSIYNMMGVITLYFVKIVLSFTGKTVLIWIMGDEYNGINALFTSMISMLSIVELGIGSAITYNLYQPMKENDRETLKSIMYFYKNCYRIIAVIVMLLGVCCSPMVKSLVGEVRIQDNIYVIYYFFLFDSAASYLLSYKRSILYAAQKNYIISICDIGYTVCLQLLQIFVLVTSRNFIFYLLVGIICRVLENLIIQFWANKKYPFLKEKNVEKLAVSIRKDIIEKVKGLLFHKIGSYIVFGTDNMIISRMVNIVAEGLYSNYLTIINPLSSIIAQMITSLQASVGNLLVEKDKEKNYLIYKRISLLNFWLFTVAGICFFYLVQDFMILWLGNEYLFSDGVVFVLALNFWQTGMRGAIGVFKNAAGIYYEDRFVPLIESVINAAVSLILTYFYGVIGVFIGTFISSLVLFFYSFPVLVYKPLFDREYKGYVKEMVWYLMEWFLCLLVGFVVMKGVGMITMENAILAFVIKGVMIFVCSNVVLLLFHHKQKEFQYYKKFICKKVFRGKNLSKS